MEKIGLLFQPGHCELTFARNPFREGKTRSQTFHRILPARDRLGRRRELPGVHTGFLGQRLQKASSAHHRAPSSNGLRALRMNTHGYIGC